MDGAQVLVARAEARAASGALALAEELFAEAEAALAESGWADDSDQALDLLVRRLPVTLALRPGEPPVGPELLRRVLARPPAQDTPVVRRLLAILAIASWLSGEPEGLDLSAALAARSWGGGAYLAAGLATDRATFALVAVLAQVGQEPTALELLDVAVGAARAAGDDATAATMRGMRGAVLLAAGDLPGAIAELGASLDATARDALVSRASPLPFLAYACTVAGDLEAIRSRLAPSPRDDAALLAESYVARAWLLLAEGRTEAALTLATEAGELDEVGGIAWASGWRGVAAQAALAAGDRVRAAELAEEELALLERWRFPPAKRVENAILRTRLGAAGAEAELDALRARLVPSSFQVGLIDTRLAELDAEREQRRQLTRSEERVARLARDGLSNREIAAALFLSPKTVEFHLTGSYRKLGIDSRAGLAGLEF